MILLAFTKIFVAVLPIVFSFVALRLFGADVYGNFVVYQSYLMVLALFFRFGTNVLIVKEVPIENIKSPFLGFSLMIVLILGIVTSLLYYLGFLFGSGEGLRYIVGACMISVTYILSGFFKGQGRPILSSVIEYPAVFIVFIPLVLLFYFLGVELALEDVFLISVVGLLVVLSMHWIRAVSFLGVTDLFNFNNMKNNFNIFIFGLSGVLQTHFVFIYFSAGVSSEELAWVKVFQQISMVMSFYLLVVNPYYSKRLAQDWIKGQVGSIRSIYLNIIKFAAVYTLLLGLLYLLFQESIFKFFLIPRNQEIFFVSLVLLAGQALSGLTGPAIYCLCIFDNTSFVRKLGLVSVSLVLTTLYLSDVGNIFHLSLCLVVATVFNNFLAFLRLAKVIQLIR